MQRILNLKGESTAEVMDIITPVVPIIRTATIVRNATFTNSSGGTIWTTPADRDFYLTHLNFSSCKDVNAVSAYVSIKVYIDGVQRTIATISSITLTAQQNTVDCDYSIPIKLDRNTTIELDTGSAVAANRHMATVIGYTMDTYVSSGI